MAAETPEFLARTIGPEGLIGGQADDLLDADAEESPFQTAAERAEARRRAQDLRDRALHAVEPLGPRADSFRELAAFVVNRSEQRASAADRGYRAGHGVGRRRLVY